MITIDVFFVLCVISVEFERLKLEANSFMSEMRDRLFSLILHSSDSSLVYRNTRTHMQTREYAIKVPIDIIFISCCRSKRLDKTPKRKYC